MILIKILIISKELFSINIYSLKMILEIQDLKEIHQSLYINRMIANDLFFTSNTNPRSLHNLNQHLLIGGIMLMITRKDINVI